MLNGTLEKTNYGRSSNIELLKVIAIFLIIFYHMTSTLTAYSTNANETVSSYVLNIEKLSLTNPVRAFFFAMFQKLGGIGNDIFFVCSAWFLADSKKRYGEKVLSLLSKVWIVSVIILIAVEIHGKFHLGGATVLRCLLPSTFSNNWYISKYVLFLMIVPFLNIVCEKLPQKKHLIFVVFVIVLRVIIDPFTSEWANDRISAGLGSWIVMYLIIAYMKKYLPHFSNSIFKNIILLIMGTALYAVTVFVSLFKPNCSSYIKILIFQWDSNTFFLVVIAITLFNIFRNINIRSKLINRISKESLLIYVIHENLLIRHYYRPLVLTYIHDNMGYDHIIMWMFLLAAVTFIVSFALALLFDKTIGKLSDKFVKWCYPKIVTAGNRVLDKMILIK